MPSFYDTVLRNSKAFRSDAPCKDTSLLEPGTRAAVLALLAAAHAQGIDLRVLETYRSQARQSMLFVQRHTQLRVVGCHGYGLAADFGVFINGRYAEDNKPYVFLRTMARDHGLISGQDWGHVKTGSFVDSGHVQRVPVWRQAALFSGSWYPPTQYDPYQDSIGGGHPDVVASIGVQAARDVLAMPKPKGNTGIVATVFGGSAEPQNNSYTGLPIDDAVLGVALPARLTGSRPKVRVTNGSKSAIADVVDVGPWNRSDPYWVAGKRPQAESGTDVQGRRTNKAGIDLTPALAKAIGIDGKGVVDWEFVI